MTSHAPGPVRRPRTEHRLSDAPMLGPLQSTGSGPASSRSSTRTASSSRRPPGWDTRETSSPRRSCFGAVALPASAAASDSAEVRRVDFGSFPLVRVTAVAGRQPPGASRGQPPRRLHESPGSRLGERARARRGQLQLDVGSTAAGGQAGRGAVPRRTPPGRNDRPGRVRARGSRVDPPGDSKSDVGRALETLRRTPRSEQRFTTQSSCRSHACSGCRTALVSSCC